MTPEAIVFGGVGALTECADLDRMAWNAAFRAHGLTWCWSWEVYRGLLQGGGDCPPVSRFARRIGAEVNIAALEECQTRLFAARLSEGLPLRPGVAGTLVWAARAGIRLALISRSGGPPVRALLKATARARMGVALDAVILRADLDRLPPHPQAYEIALGALGVAPRAALAVVDSPVAAGAADRAGIPVLAFPGALAEADAARFEKVRGLSHHLSPGILRSAWRRHRGAAAE